MNSQSPGTLHDGNDDGVGDDGLVRHSEVEGGAVDAVAEEVRPVQLLAHPVKCQSLH